MINLKELSLVSGKAAWMAYLVSCDGLYYLWLCVLKPAVNSCMLVAQHGLALSSIKN